MRAPAYPLVTHSPMFSVWSFEDAPNTGRTRHWTGRVHDLHLVARLKGETLVLVGQPGEGERPAAHLGTEITPLRTIFRYEGGIEVEFLSPVFPEDIRILARPVTYIRVTGAEASHLDVSGGLGVDDFKQTVTGGGMGDAGFLRADPQRKLARSGDNHRIEWGTLALAAGENRAHYGMQAELRTAFREGRRPISLGPAPHRVEDGWPSLGVRIVGDGTYLLAFDEEHPVQYLGRPLPALWREEFADLPALMDGAERDREALRERAIAYDADLQSRLREVGGDDYERVASLAFRQTLAAYALVRDVDGQLHMFSKENFSNGCIGTVDVTYPAAPFFLAFNPVLLKAHLVFVMDYSASGRWKFPFAPHDLGQYPLADGQVYGGGERTEKDQMPVEECGNMLVLVSLLDDPMFLAKYEGVLDGWADYLVRHGLDPENQLCTDDFAGHLARNANLGVKAIVGLAAYGRATGKRHYEDAAHEMAHEWTHLAAEGDATKLTYDLSGSWSQKYNMVWDRLLGLDLWAQEVREREMASYLGKQKAFGLPLDSRADYTKIDWIVWCAGLTGRKSDLEALAAPLALWLEHTPDRVPLADWYDTVTGKHHEFRARSVVGGLFLPLIQPRRLERRPRDVEVRVGLKVKTPAKKKVPAA